MRQSKLFSKTRKEAPSDETSRNAELLIRAGFVHKEMAGVYSYLPLGLRVLNKVIGVIRKEINAIGAEEVFLSSLQDKSLWEKTNRWDDQVVDNWFKTKFKNGSEVGLGFTHEEPLSAIMRDHIHSFRDLPVFVYQFQTKFRNEARAKSGLMRTREFVMKDLYSFCRDEKEQEELYAKARGAYVRIFDRVGLGSVTFPTFASGGTFSKYSEEFQTISDAGEDTIYVDEKKKIAVNKEVFKDEVLADLGLKKSELVEKKSIEVGNIFSQGKRFSEPIGLFYLDEKGEKKPVVTGAYGIGPGRLIGAIVEVLNDKKGIVWPREVAPFVAHLIEINPKGEPAVAREAEQVYKELTAAGIETLWDDRPATAGEKFADSDLIGIPVRLVVSEKTLTKNIVEFKNRSSDKSENIPRLEILSRIQSQ